MKGPMRALGLALFVLVTWPLIAAERAHAQYPDLIDIGIQYLPPVEIDVRPAKAQVTVYDLSLNVPIVLAEGSTFLIPNASYHAESMSYSDAPPELDQLKLLQAIDAAALFVQVLPSDWSLSVRLSAGLAGDFAAIDHRLLRVSTLIMASHAFSKSFVLGGGAVSNYAFGTLLPLPVVYLDYLPVPELRFETFLPGWVNVRYTIAKRVELGVRGELYGNSFGIRSAQVRDDWPCVALPRDNPEQPGRQDLAAADSCVDHVAYSIISAGVHLGVRLYSTLWLTSFIGRTLYRRVEPMNAGDKPISGELDTFPNAWTARFNLSWRVPRE
jgi:hypothetical protein